MNRFHAPPERIRHGEAVIEGAAARHISRVLRFNPGDQIRIFDGKGHEYLARIREISGQRIIAALEKALTDLTSNNRPAGEPLLQVVLCQGIPKGEKMEFILQKGTELGAVRFIPLVTERTVVRLEAARADNRRLRWQRVATEAARQCQRQMIPQVDSVQSLNQALTLVPSEAVGLIPWEDETATTLKDLIRQMPEAPPQVWVFIGPEGGFSAAEITQARQAVLVPVSLGPRILRTETAGLAVLTMLLYAWGDLGGEG